uniref:P2X purinoceptor n=1 Tax=Bubo bubo TaxID=30461 RepID=A0A8C0ICL0_BUBBB
MIQRSRPILFSWAYLSFLFYLASCVVIIYRLYQEMDEVNSSIRTSVKGVAYTDNRIWDTAEYTIPMQAVNSFFVMTNIIKTENQLEWRCPEVTMFCDLYLGLRACFSTGIQTGRCVNYNATVKTCEVKAWCPISAFFLMRSEDFTVLIKNNIHFPKFNYTILNIPQHLNTSCTYNKITSPLCPIFRLGDILQEAKENFSEMAVKGGIIAIEINWDCNLDRWFYDCHPEYGFRRLDDKKIKPGFQYAKYYKLPNGKEQRTLFKVYGIRFDVLVFGTGRKFNAIELIKNVGSMMSYFGLVVTAIEIAICVGNCSGCCKSPFYRLYNRKKFETVLNPRQVMYVSYVDEPHVTLIKKPLKTSLQHTQGSIVESDPVKFDDAGGCCRSEAEENDDNEEYALTHALRPGASSPYFPEWCRCGKCRPTQEFHEQLCCRRKEGPCITTSQLFQQLVLSRQTLDKALLYKDPFLDLTDDNINNQLRHLAYKQYVHWRFGSFDLEDRAVVPSCCRWKIRDAYPKEDHDYTGFEME